MREAVSCVSKTPEALKKPPDIGKCGQKAEQVRSRRAALGAVGTVEAFAPVGVVEAEEHGGVGERVGERAEDVAEEEVTELDRVEAAQEEPENGRQKPLAGLEIEDVKRAEHDGKCKSDKSPWPVAPVERLGPEVHETEPGGAGADEEKKHWDDEVLAEVQVVARAELEDQLIVDLVVVPDEAVDAEENRHEAEKKEPCPNLHEPLSLRQVPR